MLDPDFLLKLVIGFFALVGGFLVRDRQLLKTITSGDEKLHQRINEVRETFVRRKDFENYIQTMKEQNDRSYNEQNEMNRKMEKMLEKIDNLRDRMP